MKFAKIIKDISGEVAEVFSGKFVKDSVNHKIYVHPTETQLRLCGYKGYTENDCTLEVKEGYDIVKTYTETDTEITAVWEYAKKAEDTEYELSAT